MSFKSKTLKKIVTSLVMATTVLASVPAMAVDYIGIGTVTGSTVNIRNGVGTTSPIIGRTNYGATYPALASQDGWVQISYNGESAWICGSYFSVAPVTIDNSNGLVKGDMVNIRTAPSIESDVIDMVQQGTKLIVLGEEDGWYKVSHNGITGYISMDYFTKNGVITGIAASTGGAVVNEAMRHVGKAYVYGASGPYAFDCSGFTMYVYRQLGYSLNRTAASQMSNGVSVARENLIPGDLLFFRDRGTSYIGHVGIYIGNNQMVHASTSTTGVIITDLNSGYYNERYAGARRIIK